MVVLTTDALRPNSAPNVDRWTLNSSIASGLGRMPALPKRAFRVSMPFTRKLLFDSRPPLIESVVSLRPVQVEAGDTPMPNGTAPDESCASWMKLRPFSGRSTSALPSMTCPIAALSAFSSVVCAADTVTAVSSWLTSSFTSTRARCPTCTRMSLTTVVWNPSSATFRL